VARGEFVLRVDPDAHAAEIARFWAKVVRGPGSACWIWTGAIGDDGYGNFSIRRPADGSLGELREHCVSAPRYALAAVYGAVLGPGDVAEHVVCDEPICVRAHEGVYEGFRPHLVVSTQAENLATMGRRGRGGGPGWAWRWRGTDRASMQARSLAIRGAVREHGWNADRIAEALAAMAAKNGQSTLF
jgi:hypothetical protein